MKKSQAKQRTPTTWMLEPLFLDAERAAVLLGVSPQIVRKWAREGRIPAEKYGPRLWRFEKSALMKFAGVQE